MCPDLAIAWLNFSLRLVRSLAFPLMGKIFLKTLRFISALCTTRNQYFALFSNWNAFVRSLAGLRAMITRSADPMRATLAPHTLETCEGIQLKSFGFFYVDDRLKNFISNDNAYQLFPSKTRRSKKQLHPLIYNFLRLSSSLFQPGFNLLFPTHMRVTLEPLQSLPIPIVNHSTLSSHSITSKRSLTVSRCLVFQLKR